MAAIAVSCAVAGCILSSADDSRRTGGKDGCYIGGCSSQLCTDRDDIGSTCEWLDEYACYRTATCERQATGECGWTQTAELVTCLDSH